MKMVDDFVIDFPYELTEDDIKAIHKASPLIKHKEHWENDCLNDFKRRFRKAMLPKQNYRCAYCRLELHPNEVTPEIDHIMPKSLKTTWMYEPFNLCLSCKACNTKKSNKNVLQNNVLDDVLPHDSASFKIIHPYIDRYSDNIELVGNILYKGISDKGIYTIQLCKLDRYEVAAVRAMELIKQGVYDEISIIFFLEDPNNKNLVNDLNAFLADIKNRIKTYKQEIMW